jgi:hypothetical protein
MENWRAFIPKSITVQGAAHVCLGLHDTFGCVEQFLPSSLPSPITVAGRYISDLLSVGDPHVYGPDNGAGS